MYFSSLEAVQEWFEEKMTTLSSELNTQDMHNLLTNLTSWAILLQTFAGWIIRRISFERSINTSTSTNSTALLIHATFIRCRGQPLIWSNNLSPVKLVECAYIVFWRPEINQRLSAESKKSWMSKHWRNQKRWNPSSESSEMRDFFQLSRREISGGSFT